MMRVVLVTTAIVICAASAAGADDDPCRHAQQTQDFNKCWHEQFQKSETEVQQKLRRLIERNRKDEPPLADLLTKAQRAWLTWRKAACKVETYDSRSGTGFSVYWDKCLIKMNLARSAELQEMLDNP